CLHSIDVTVIVIQIDVATVGVSTDLLMQEVPVYKIGADGEVAPELPLHSQAEVLGGTGSEVVGDQFRTAFGEIDSSERQVRIVGIEVHLLRDTGADDRQNA